jgi:hypothetical protein
MPKMFGNFRLGDAANGKRIYMADGCARELADIYAYLLALPPLPDPKSAAILDN